MSEVDRRCQARILGPDGRRVVGGGLLYRPDAVVTCAHVVGPEPVPVLVDFPFLPEVPPVTAEVSSWHPLTPEGRGDVAVLSLSATPPGAAPPPLGDPDAGAGSGAGAGYRVYGFPAGYPDGLWARGTVSGRTAGGLLQLDGRTGQGARLARGFSGSPVWDEEQEAVIGIVAAVERDPATALGFALPVGTPPGAWPAPARAPLPATRLTVRAPDGTVIRVVPLSHQPDGTGELWVGRETPAGARPPIAVPDRERVVSRFHCLLVCVRGRWHVEPAPDTVGTFLRRSGQRGGPDRIDGRTQLWHGDAVWLRADRSPAGTGRHRYWSLEFADDQSTWRPAPRDAGSGAESRS
ncbi:trypsin-like peptidase domain-containing protein [Phaeacidiphilus oryzae]|uniref:trypsin-like peptidase domain-containing protein n=1 Tax=Phaeacidiphilus oryzae TaxID=348818 RepID=UPI00056BD67D|nr:trypsin-like peptidase domain-containing protein [Phaeacidiphilus oryzae]